MAATSKLYTNQLNNTLSPSQTKHSFTIRRTAEPNDQSQFLNINE